MLWKSARLSAKFHIVNKVLQLSTYNYIIRYFDVYVKAMVGYSLIGFHLKLGLLHLGC